MNHPTHCLFSLYLMFLFFTSPLWDFFINDVAKENWIYRQHTKLAMGFGFEFGVVVYRFATSQVHICTYTSTYIWTLYIRSYLRSNWKKSEEYKTITVWVVHIEHWKRFPLLISFLCWDPHSLIFSLCFQWFQATPEKYIYTYVHMYVYHCGWPSA